MVLDKEEHRKLLLEVINNTAIQGDYAGIKKAMVAFDELVEAVTRATIAEATDGKSQ